MTTPDQIDNTQYRVMLRADLNRIDEQNAANVDTFYIIDYNAGFVTIFKDGTSMIVPPVMGGDEGLFFYDVKEMEKMIKSRKYPVKGNGSFWEREKERIVNINTEMPYFCNRVSSFLKIPIEVSNDPTYLTELQNAIRKVFAKGKVKDDNYAYLTMYISELIRQRLNGEWKFFPEWDLNMTYSLEIRVGDKACNPFNSIIGELELIDGEPPLFDIKQTMDSASRLFPYVETRYVTPY